MEPQIQYSRTVDGQSIAFFAMGSGPVLIGMSPHLGMTIAKSLKGIAEAQRVYAVRKDGA
ncbi:MAG: hypothetical protein HY873_01745 [Chloroflexi bacterium]|nr:hypothetical protein [Chloroflexota bacterium]